MLSLVPNNQKIPTKSVQVTTPSGVLYVNFLEDEDGKCFNIMLHLGKTGSELRAMIAGIEATINLAIKTHELVEIADSLSNINSDKVSYNSKRNVNSTTDGIVYAIHRYLNEVDRVKNSRPFLNQYWLEVSEDEE